MVGRQGFGQKGGAHGFGGGGAELLLTPLLSLQSSSRPPTALATWLAVVGRYVLLIHRLALSAF